MTKWEALRRKEAFRITLVAIQEVSLDHEIDRKRDTKSHPKSIKIAAAGAQGHFFIILAANSLPQIQKMLSYWRPKSKKVIFVCRSSGMCGAAREVRKG